MGESYYELLGVEPDATTEEIEQAYRERLKESHPDVSDEEDASERTKKLIEAKEVLTDEDERAQYDRLGHRNYVGEDSRTATDPAGKRKQTRNTNRNRSRASRNTESETHSRERTTTQRTRQNTTSQQRRNRRRRNREKATAQQSWYAGNDGEGWSDDGEWSAWNTEGSFSVSNDTGRFGRQTIFSRRSISLFVTSFIVYPILLFTSLFPEFPLGVNLSVGMFVIMLIFYLQSVPDIGIAVFSSWSILLPVALYWAGFSFLDLWILMLMAGVLFPLLLSFLTRIALGPLSV